MWLCRWRAGRGPDSAIQNALGSVGLATANATDTAERKINWCSAFGRVQ